jgi:Domain of unknown function (DUF4397)
VVGARRSRFVVALAALALACAFALPGALPASAATRTGTVYVLQGLPGMSVDVAVDGGRVARDVSSTTVVGPLHLAPGRHTVAISENGKGLVSASVTVGAGASIDVLAYCAAEAPHTSRIAVLRNDLSPVASGKTRLVVTHGIAAPPADIRVNGKVLFRSVANGESLSVVVPAGTYRVSAVATLTGQTLLPESSLTVRAGTLTRAVAIGAPGMAPAVLVHVLPLPGRASGDRMPSAVHTGDGGQAAGLFGSAGGFAGLPPLPFELLSVTFLLLALGVAASARRAAMASRHAR